MSQLKSREKISIEEFYKYVSYNPQTGEFTRIAIYNNDSRLFKNIGKVIGNPSSSGYLEISVGNSKFSAHKLAWYFTYGEVPDENIDHIDGNKQNNRIDNLRLFTPLENMRNRGTNKNNTTGYNGVYLTSSGKYRARIKIKGKLIGLGTFVNFDDAVKARKEANELYGFDDNHGERESWISQKS